MYPCFLKKVIQSTVFSAAASLETQLITITKWQDRNIKIYSIYIFLRLKKKNSDPQPLQADTDRDRTEIIVHSNEKYRTEKLIRPCSIVSSISTVWVIRLKSVVLIQTRSDERRLRSAQVWRLSSPALCCLVSNVHFTMRLSKPCFQKHLHCFLPVARCSS